MEASASVHSDMSVPLAQRNARSAGVTSRLVGRQTRSDIPGIGIGIRNERGAEGVRDGWALGDSSGLVSVSPVVWLRVWMLPTLLSPHYSLILICSTSAAKRTR